MGPVGVLESMQLLQKLLHQINLRIHFVQTKQICTVFTLSKLTKKIYLFLMLFVAGDMAR